MLVFGFFRVLGWVAGFAKGELCGARAFRSTCALNQRHIERESLEFEITFVGYIEAVVEPLAVVLFDLDAGRRKPLASNLRR